MMTGSLLKFKFGIGCCINEKTFRDRGSGFVIGFYRMTRDRLETGDL